MKSPQRIQFLLEKDIMYVISNIYSFFVHNNEHIFKMATKKQIIFPKYDKVLGEMGENIKLARKRRKLTMIQVAERADIALRYI